MGKVKEISVNYSRTVNLGNFESAKVDIGEVVTVGAKEDPIKVREVAFSEIKAAVAAHVRAIKEKQGAGK